MKYCNYCGHPNPDDSLFCGSCGKSLNPSNGGGMNSFASQQQHATRKSSWINSLNEYVGNDRPADLNWKVLFSDVFKSHTTEEAETIFICGTKTTTPVPSEVSKDWPRPWLYGRVFLMFAIAFCLLWMCCSMFGNPNALPGLIVVGSFTVPLSTLILFLELNAWRNISMYHVLQTFLVGGCASLVATLFLFSFFGAQELDFFGAFMTGFIEETGKAVIVFYFLKKLNRLSILGGLLIGAAVGAGFAAFESAGYAMNFLLQGGWDVMMDVIFLRGFLTPGGHVVWAAISSAALVITAKAQNGLSTNLLYDTKFLRLFVIPVVLHGIWDSPLCAIGSEIYLVPIGLTVLAWIVVLIFINMGLAEVSRESSLQNYIQE